MQAVVAVASERTLEGQRARGVKAMAGRMPPEHEASTFA